MASTKRLVKSFYRLLLPIVVLLVVAFVGSSVWLVHNSANAPKNTYLMTPEKYGLLSTRGAKITDETWTNMDGTSARGWLLRGAEGAPAVILLHRYGADRSWVLNLGVKLNEATDFTILMPDLRGHGESPLVKKTFFGGHEADDTVAALEYLKSLKSENNVELVGKTFGIYGVEMGALAAISAASKEPNVKALALDSVLKDSDDLLASIIDKKYPFASSLTSRIAKFGTYSYFFNGGYSRESMCDNAKTISNRQILVLAGNDTPNIQASSVEIANCFSNPAKVQKKLDLMPSGYNIVSASIEQSSIYDERVIDFFKNSLLTVSE
jgi:pimeloyl-ACP methyl ester carboxylesterase